MKTSLFIDTSSCIMIGSFGGCISCTTFLNKTVTQRASALPVELCGEKKLTNQNKNKKITCQHATHTGRKKRKRKTNRSSYCRWEVNEFSGMLWQEPPGRALSLSLPLSLKGCWWEERGAYSAAKHVYTTRRGLKCSNNWVGWRIGEP